ncbi:MAG TPA: hypothetical protein VI136_04700 [Verrucomicrobiae bacterium]
MKTINLLEYMRHQRGKLIACWGEAELVRHLDGRYELRGGTPEDRQAAREWVSLFLHEAVVAA